MKIPYVTAIIERDPMEKISRIVLPHEIPILEMVHNKAVHVDENHIPEVEPKEVENPQDEYERLMGTYGDDPKTGIPYVERVFGNLSSFGSALEELADKAGQSAPKRRGRRAAATANQEEGGEE